MRTVLVAIALVACASSELRPSPPPARPARAETRLDVAIRTAAEKLRSLAQPDGSFLYEYRVRDGREIGGYNIVRHAGAIYALAMYEHVSPDARTRDVIARASHYLLDAVKPLASPAGTSAVFSMPSPGELDDDAVLGGTALGVVALISADSLAPESIPAATLRALGNFIVYMQRADGSFFSTYTPGEGVTNRFDSLYYPGEAILALARLAAWDKTHDPRWHDAAMRGIRFLATSRAKATDLPSDNWALVATEELIGQGGVAAGDRELLVRHAEQIVAVNTSTQIADPKNPLYGCFTDDGRTTPSSTHLEGLLAAAAVVPREHVAASIAAGIQFLLASQMPDGAMPADQRRKTVRIDFIQHALSAFIRYRAFSGAR
ncbi:MAG TPA: hypothetical protein VGG74_00970 [Kofleriaceae bacterium]